MPKDNEARAREVLAAIVEADEAANGARSTSPLGKSTAYYIRDGQGASITAWAAIRAMLAYQSEAPAQGELERAADLWQDLLDKDDRTSPEDYPDHALITYDELADYIARATISKTETVGLPLADREAIANRVFAVLWPHESWSDFDDRHSVRGGYHPMQLRAFEIADAILALSGSLPPSPVGEGKCTCAEIHGEDPNCALHGDKTQWGIENAECWNCGVPVNRPVGEGITTPAPVRGE